MTMKKILFLSSLAIAAAFTVSCNKENIEGDAATAGESALFPASSVISASSASTKTTLDGTSILWAEGDAITLFGENGTPVKYDLVSGAGTKSGQFENQDAAGQVTAYAVYPATENTLAESKVAVTVAAAQNYAADGFPTDYPMAAVTENGTDFTFENLATVLRLQLKGDATVASVTVRTLGENEYIAGAATIDFTSGTPVLAASAEGAASAVTLDCGDGVALSAENETVFNFILIPGEYDGFEITVTDADGHQTVKTTGAVELKAGSIKTFESPLEINKGWQIIGSFTDNWGAGIYMDGSDNFYYAKDVVIPANGEFKIRYGATWDGISYGYGQNDYKENFDTNLGIAVYSGQNNIVVTPSTPASENKYDIYFYHNPEGDNFVFVVDAGTMPSVSVYGTCNDLGNTPMTFDGYYFVAKGNNFNSAEGWFKIKNTSTWSYLNIGFESDGTIAYNAPLNVKNNVNGNMKVPEAGTFDIYLDLFNMQVWVMTPGQVPAE